VGGYPAGVQPSYGIGMIVNSYECIISNNVIFDKDYRGIHVNQRSICNGNLYYGDNVCDSVISIQGDGCIVSGNILIATFGAGIRVEAGTSGYHLIHGNWIVNEYGTGTRRCILIDNSEGYINIIDNYMGRITDTTPFGVEIQVGDNCRIDGNMFFQCVTGIFITAATVDNTKILNNAFYGCTTCVSDLGTNTVFHTILVPFLEPIGTATWDVTPPSGIDVDAADEGAFTMGVIPPTCQQTMKIVVWAVGLTGPGAGNQMEMTFNMDAGQPDEAYNAEAIAVANKDSDQTDFAANDIVTWTFTPSDDSDIGDLIARDCFEIRAMFVAGGAPDIDTDALFRCAEIHYV